MKMSSWMIFSRSLLSQIDYIADRLLLITYWFMLSNTSHKMKLTCTNHFIKKINLPLANITFLSLHVCIWMFLLRKESSFREVSEGHFRQWTYTIRTNFGWNRWSKPLLWKCGLQTDGWTTEDWFYKLSRVSRKYSC